MRTLPIVTLTAAGLTTTNGFAVIVAERGACVLVRRAPRSALGA